MEKQAVTQQKEMKSSSPSNKVVNEEVKQPNGKQEKPAGSSDSKGSSKKANAPKPVDPIICSREIFSWAEAKAIARIDGKDLSQNVGKYAAKNQFQYYVGLNTWAFVVIPEPDFEKETTFREWVLFYGLRRCVEIAKDLANRLVETLEDEGVGNGFVDVNPLAPEAYSLMYCVEEREISETLTCLRFLKRFTPVEADEVRNKSMQKFKDILHDTNWRIVAAEHAPLDPDLVPRREWAWIKMVKKYMDEILRDFPKYYAQASMKFSSGNCTDGNTLVEKIAAYSECSPYFDIVGFGFPDGVRDNLNKRKCGKPLPRGCYYNVLEKKGPAKNKFIPEVGSVPKTLFDNRIIGPESAYVSANMQRVREALVECVSHSKYSELFDVATQEPNRNLAQSSSLDGTYITVDLSSASDREARHIMRALINDDVWSIIDPFLPVGIKVDGHVYAPSIFLTSGNPATFMFLGILILSCALAAADLRRQYVRFEKLNKPQVFGDDALVDSRCAEEFFSVLAHLGLKVNYEKTFLKHYRESCGVEYVDGYSVTTSYWPRKTVSDPRVSSLVENIESLVSMQHRMFWNTRTRVFLYELVKRLCPSMTESEVGSPLMDLWGFNARLEPCAPHDPDKGIPKVAIDNGWANRGRHLVVKSEVPLEWEKLNNNSVEAVEVYLYYRFLATGPQYADELSRLLRVSEPIRIELSATKPALRLKPIIW